ncbi:putative ferric-chelate reductase 1 isoform X2 [Acanthaster planci]|nr:putative ferric-chelate reductase 1 isoform X2 [Acanthaster planci]XP_022089208.1 putative ferric-chelate reductase 1 isoform X2 [Acanthaster planci]
MNIRVSFPALVLPVILLQMTCLTFGQDVSSSTCTRHKRHGDRTGDQTVGLNGCGQFKGCFNQPSECTGDGCTAYVTWETLPSGESRFSLRARADGWVAVGFRPADATGNGMIPADVYACTSREQVRRSINQRLDGSLNSVARLPPNDTVSLQNASSSNGVITCTFTRKPNFEGDESFYDIGGNNQYFILLAYGNSIQSDGTIQGNIHAERWSTAEARNLQTDFSRPMAEGEALPKAHASLMVIAWLGFASVGITMARFFKPMWPNSKLLGTKVWFALHRICMVSCVLCFSVAFVLIFVHLEGFVELSETLSVIHAICGIAVTVLGIINPIMALFRPHPGTANRPIFNWAHWGVGTGAHLLALATIFIGIGINGSSLLDGLPNYVFIVMVVFIVFHIVMWILFEIQRCMTESQGRTNDVALKSSGDSTNHLAVDVDSDPPTDDLMVEGPCISQVTEEGSTAKTILLCVYAVGVIVAVVFFVISFAIN